MIWKKAVLIGDDPMLVEFVVTYLSESFERNEIWIDGDRIIFFGIQVDSTTNVLLFVLCQPCFCKELETAVFSAAHSLICVAKTSESSFIDEWSSFAMSAAVLNTCENLVVSEYERLFNKRSPHFNQILQQRLHNCSVTILEGLMQWSELGKDRVELCEVKSLTDFGQFGELFKHSHDIYCKGRLIEEVQFGLRQQ